MKASVSSKNRLIDRFSILSTTSSVSPFVRYCCMSNQCIFYLQASFKCKCYGKCAKEADKLCHLMIYLPTSVTFIMVHAAMCFVCSVQSQ